MKYNYFFIRCCFLILQFFCNQSWSQQINSPALKFEHINSDNGLSNRNTTVMMKDSKGFLWIATIDGVNRYDGYEFKIFRNSPYDSTTISKGWPMVIAEDKKGTIWIACSTPQGLNAYNPTTGKFKRYSDNPVYKNILPDKVLNYIYPDENNFLWIATQGQGLLKFDPATDKAIYFKHDSLDNSSIHDNSPSVICRADSGHLYVAMPDGFDLFDMQTGKCRHFFTGTSNSVNSVDVWNYIFKDSKNNLWICTHEGLKMFDPVTEKITTYRHDKSKPYSISTDTLSFMCESPDGKLWITSSMEPIGNGLNIFDPHTKTFTHYRHAASDPFSLSTDVLSGILYDPSGKIWIQVEFGINSVNLLPDKFESFQHHDNDIHSISDNSTQYILQDKRGIIFICLYSNKGINVFDAATKTFQVYQPDAKVNHYFSQSRIDFMFEDSHFNYWVEADLNKLILFNPVTHHSEVFNYHEEHHPDSLGVGCVYDMYEDSKGIIWIGGEYHLAAYNPATHTFKNYLIDPLMPGTDVNQVGKFVDWGDGKMWMATACGLAYYDQAKDTIVISGFTKNKAASIVSAHGLTAMLPEKKNQLWLGTMGQGLFFIDVETGNCVNFNAEDGLPNDVVWGILKDKKNNLWLATNNGICRFTPSKEFLNFSDKSPKGIFRNYNTSDGIPAKEFAWNCYRKINDGSMLFGLYSLSGLVRFHPDSLHDNTFASPVYITHFSLFNKEVIASSENKFLKTTIETTKEIILSYRENVFSFGFAALSFVHPENNKYAYMLEGFDKDWIYTDATKRFANYTNIDPGEYLFKVKGSNNDGKWNEIPAIIKLIITPPYWQRWWFRILTAAATAAAAYALYRFRVNQLVRLQNIRNKIAHDLHDDIGSTLNSISVFSEVAKQEPEKHKEALDMIGESSRKVIDAMSDIVWAINPEHDSFEDIILRMRSFSYNLLRAKNIEHLFRADESLNDLKLSLEDRRNFYLFFKEVINNLVKHSEATRAEIHLTNENRFITLTIRDNGKGFDTLKEYNGNGLNSLRNRAKELDSELKIESAANSGTTVQLKINI